MAASGKTVRITGAEMIRRVLEEQGVDLVFGIPGTHNMTIYDQLGLSESITPILVTDEQSASFMADAVSRTTDRMGVVALVPSAGLTHALSGIAEAFLDAVPMVVILTGMRTDTGKKYQLHEVDQLAICRPVVKEAIHVAKGDDLGPELRRAFRLAREGRPGPVAVEVPVNLTLFGAEFPPFDGTPTEPPTTDAKARREAVELLAASERPMLYVGAGAAGAADLLPRLAEILSAPVTTTIQGIGVFPHEHPLHLWAILGASAPLFANRIQKEADLVLAIGARFGEVATGSYGYDPPAELIHVDIDPEVPNANYPARVAIVADARAFVKDLIDRESKLARERWDMRGRIATGKEGFRKKALERSVKGRVNPARLIDTLQELCPADTLYTTDSGNHTFITVESLRLSRPMQLIGPVDYSCMGYGVPAAIGASLANPGRRVVGLVGDGGFLMTGMELLTAAGYGASPVICLFNDGELGLIGQFQKISFGESTAVDLEPANWRALAAATRAGYVAIKDDDQIRDGLQRAFKKADEGQPVLVEVLVDYTPMTQYAKGVLKTNLRRLDTANKVRFVARSVKRRVQAVFKGKRKGR